MRRTKRDLERMNHECRIYLLQSNNDPHKAHEQMIKDCFATGEPIPYFIKGVKDFIKVSQELAIDLNRKEQMKKADKEKFIEKEVIINWLMELTLQEARSVYNTFKDELKGNDKLTLHNIYMMTVEPKKEDRKQYIDQPTINLVNNLKLLQLAEV